MSTTLEKPITKLSNFVAGKIAPSTSNGSYLPVTNPATGAIIAQVPLCGADDVNRAVESARAAQPAWAAMPIKERVQVFFRYKTLMEKHIDELSALVSEENGKVMSEARAEVEKSIEVTEFATSMP
ncbi:MAG TPA: aldehyde dehydrogenase family protein, partial [Bacteroidota bacterium]|nr:aldehyde dehydrogenase family protein [Bacteroidota bacterium]